jgi:prephenate dehydrogenase
MTVNITIIGLGQIGTSIGLALAEHTDKVQRTGHDKSREQVNTAHKLGALDKAEFNLPSSVENADVVILSLPFDAIEETLKLIAPDLRPNCVVVDTAPQKSPVANWMRTHLPSGCHYIGLVPAPSPNHITSVDRPPHADLFQGGLFGLVNPPGTSGEAIKLVSDLLTLLGAQPFFIDMTEADNLMASAHILPQLLAATLLDMTVDAPGWREMRRLAGRPYATATLNAVSQDEPAALVRAALDNTQASLYAIDTFMQTLASLRAAIAEGKFDELTKRIEQTCDGRDTWWLERASGDWQKIEFGISEQPRNPSLLGEWFGRKRDK